MSRQRLHDDKFLAFLRGRSCSACGRNPPCEAAHIRIGFGAMGKKPDDRFATPLCPGCHREQHSMNETTFWGVHAKNPFDIAARLYAEYGGDGGHEKRPKKMKPRKPAHMRKKIRSRPWPSKTS